ncbi:MAG: substrate-binding domain-containing protein, partial [Thermoactinomyces sp.]
ALTENGIPLDHDFILSDVREEEEFIYSQLEQMKNQPTAWFCVNDGLGFLVSTCLQKMGKKIPEEISICSFDNGPLSQMATPKITTVDIDLELFGRKAVEQLCWRMENRHEPFMEILLPAKLIPRESTASTLSENEFKGRDR